MQTLEFCKFFVSDENNEWTCSKCGRKDFQGQIRFWNPMHSYEWVEPCEKCKVQKEWFRTNLWKDKHGRMRNYLDYLDGYPYDDGTQKKKETPMVEITDETKTLDEGKAVYMAPPKSFDAQPKSMTVEQWEKEIDSIDYDAYDDRR